MKVYALIKPNILARKRAFQKNCSTIFEGKDHCRKFLDTVNNQDEVVWEEKIKLNKFGGYVIFFHD